MKDPDCNCSSEVIWRYIDRELSARDMAGVSERIRSCDTCRGMYEEQVIAYEPPEPGQEVCELCHSGADNDKMLGNLGQ